MTALGWQRGRPARLLSIGGREGEAPRHSLMSEADRDKGAAALLFFKFTRQLHGHGAI